MLIQIEIKKDFAPYKVGDIISVNAGGGNVPLDSFWRRRLKDAKVDDCCSIVKPAVKKEVTEKVSHKIEEFEILKLHEEFLL